MFDVMVIGGACGYLAAERAGKSGLNVVLFENEVLAASA